MLAIDQTNIKINNRKRIIKLLLAERELTKLDIARKLNISVPTVTTIVGELIEEGIVEEAGVAGSTGGRKPVIIRFLPDSRFSIGLSLQKDFVRAILTNLDSNIIDDISEELESLEGEAVISCMEKLVQQLMSSNGVTSNILMGIGISLPGIVDRNKLRLQVATNFNLKDVFFQELKEKINVPVYLENEANAGALAEWNLGTAKEKESVIYISITEGVGGGMIIDQKMFKGSSMRAGEIGHMSINKDGRLCSCGKRGCFETYASNRALLKDYNNAAGLKLHSISEFVEKFRSGEATAEKVLDNYISDLSDGIENLIFIFNPHYVVIGGEISLYKDVFFDRLKNKIFENNRLYSREDINILFSLLGKDADIMGASLIPIMEGFEFYTI
ncbi:ROK family transcriptional regulator [Clostridium sp. 19966]|uniref:ROK family transcriptional regulator n=1 Tax=Clostridium sp. 19966 TaxID=2768166 RepID=UPI0028DF4F9A|nr:ROK family transcriptional regulator [Clostridium sp. 19966]MDT8716188.1 ROK family transcriptional regulator [Clostridium sp. 19966]